MTRSKKIIFSVAAIYLIVESIQFFLVGRADFDVYTGVFVPYLLTGLSAGFIATVLQPSLKKGEKLNPFIIAGSIVVATALSKMIQYHAFFEILFLGTFWIRTILSTVITTAIILAIHQNSGDISEKKEVSKEDPHVARKKEILSQWKRPDGVFDRVMNAHPILTGIGCVLAFFSGNIILLLGSELGDILSSSPSLGELVLLAVPILTFVYILLISGYLDEFFFWSRNHLFKLAGVRFSIPKYLVVAEKGDTIQLMCNDWDDYEFDLRLRHRTIHKKTHTYKTTSKDRRGNYRTTTDSWESRRIEYTREQFLDEPVKSGAGSSYDITIPKLSSITVRNSEKRHDWVLGVKVKKGIFTWFKEIYLIPGKF